MDKRVININALYMDKEYKLFPINPYILIFAYLN